MTANTRLVEEHYAASARRDLEGMLAPFADDIRWIEAAGFPLAGTYHGPQEVASRVFTALPALFDDFEVTIDEVLDAGDTVIGIGQYAGTDRRTGEPFRARVVHVWRVRDDLIVEFEQIVDSAVVPAVA